MSLMERFDHFVFSLNLRWQISEELAFIIDNSWTILTWAEDLFKIIDFMDRVMMKTRLAIFLFVLAISQI